LSFPTNKKLGRYEIHSRLGAGGMGEVYLAHDTKLDRKVALKILPTDVVAGILHRDPDPLMQFLPDVPREPERIISRALRKDRDERYQTIKDLLIDLKDLKRELESQPQRAMVSGFTSGFSTEAVHEKSIAVLYFENMHSESDDFSAGITAQLVSVRDGYHLWAERFDRMIEDIFDLQNEVSQKIIDALKVSLSDAERQALAQKPTDDLRAYDFYMRGRELLYLKGRRNTENAVQMFENAAAIDPGFLSGLSATGNDRQAFQRPRSRTRLLPPGSGVEALRRRPVAVPRRRASEARKCCGC
jgi:serine/threonine protein kinase